MEAMKSWYLKLKPHATSIAFVLGFIWDSVMLRRTDLWFSNLMLTTYLVAAAACILLSAAEGAGKLRARMTPSRAQFLLLIIQFAFGSLFSGYIVFYSRSGSIVESWPFLLFLVCIFAGNEFLKRRLQQLTFQISILFVAAFSYSIFLLPTVIGSMSAGVFILSGLLSLGVVRMFVALLARTAPSLINENVRALRFSILGIYAFFNILYFTNSIPPIPLSLKEIGVYHKITPVNTDSYSLRYEPTWFHFLARKTSDIFHHSPNEPVYVASAVFAPTRIDAIIFHEWSYYDSARDVWIVTDRLQFPISGGRDGGYRGYTTKSNITEGLWRVDVTTDRDQLIGRIRFEVVDNVSPEPLTEMVQ